MTYPHILCFQILLWSVFDNYNWKKKNPHPLILYTHSGTRIIHVLSDASCSGPKRCRRASTDDQQSERSVRPKQEVQSHTD